MVDLKTVWDGFYRVQLQAECLKVALATGMRVDWDCYRGEVHFNFLV